MNVLLKKLSKLIQIQEATNVSNGKNHHEYIKLLQYAREGCNNGLLETTTLKNFQAETPLHLVVQAHIYFDDNVNLRVPDESRIDIYTCLPKTVLNQRQLPASR
jgi:hypothetical protein